MIEDLTSVLGGFLLLSRDSKLKYNNTEQSS